MKRFHIIAVTFLAGFIAGCAVPAHASEADTLASYSGSYICGASSGVSVQVSISPETKLIQGEIVHPALYSVKDEGGNVLLSGVEFLGSEVFFVKPTSKSAFVIDTAEKAVKVFKFNKKTKKYDEKFFCGM